MSIRLSREEAWAVLDGSHTGILTTLKADGVPITLPVWFVVLDERIYVDAVARTKKVGARPPGSPGLVPRGVGRTMA